MSLPTPEDPTTPGGDNYVGGVDKSAVPLDDGLADVMREINNISLDPTSASSAGEGGETDEPIGGAVAAVMREVTAADAFSPAAAQSEGAVDALIRPNSDYRTRDASSTSSESDKTEETEEEEETDVDEGDDDAMDAMMARMRKVMRMHMYSVDQEPVLSSFDLKGIAQRIRSGKARKIVVMAGAGISVSAGIPDFRTPGTGLYDNLAKYDLPNPTSIFELGFFQENPKPFYTLAKELYPGNYAPTPTHRFIRLLHDKGLLRRCFSQNIDSLESQAGLPHDALVAAHGNFDSAHCITCSRTVNPEEVRQAVFGDEICVCDACGGLVKPDIVFFGESLPERFFRLARSDFAKADLLIVLGTSLVVTPFSMLIDLVEPDTPRLLINREKVAEAPCPGYPQGFWWGEGNTRDAICLGECDEAVERLCELLGWSGELEALCCADRKEVQGERDGNDKSET